MATAMQFAETFAKTVKFADFIVHYWPFSKDSQKVLLALEELELLCHTHSLHVWQQFEPDYLDLSPKGKVPTLQDGAHVITDCSIILHHIDNLVSSSKALFPDIHTSEGQRVKHYTELLDSVPTDLLQYGAIIHPELLAGRRRMSTCAFKKLRGIFNIKLKKLETLSEKHAELEEEYQDLINETKALQKDVNEKEKVVKQLDVLEKVLDEIEKELEHREKEHEDREYWLCSGHITSADLSLAVVLSTLYLSGYSLRFWSQKKRPFIRKYFKKLRKRKSFHNVCIYPYTCRGSVTAFIKRRPVISATIGLSVLSAVGVGIFIIAKS